MKNKSFLLRVWDYFRNSWEGDDGKASSKKLSMLSFGIQMNIYAWFVNTQIQLYVFWTFAGLFSILIGIASWQQITTLIKFTLPALGKKDPPNEEAPMDMVKEVIDDKT